MVTWIFLFSVGIDSLLKYILLHETFYASMAPMRTLLHVLATAVLEHAAFVLTTGYILRTNKEFIPFIQGQPRLRNKLYYALCVSSYFKIYAIMLQIFGSEPYLLLLCGILLLSIEALSLQSLFNTDKYSKVLPAVLGGVAVKVVMRLLLFPFADVYEQGILL